MEQKNSPRFETRITSGMLACLRALGRKERSDCETPYESMPAGASV